MEAVCGVDDQIGITALEGLGRFTPLAEDDAIGNVEFAEDDLQQVDVVACWLALVVTVFIRREVPVACYDDRIVFGVTEFQLCLCWYGEKVG